MRNSCVSPTLSYHAMKYSLLINVRMQQQNLQIWTSYLQFFLGGERGAKPPDHHTGEVAYRHPSQTQPHSHVKTPDLAACRMSATAFDRSRPIGSDNAEIIQLYSPGGAHLYTFNTLAHVYESLFIPNGIASLILDRFSRFCRVNQTCNQRIDRQTYRPHYVTNMCRNSQQSASTTSTSKLFLQCWRCGQVSNWQWQLQLEK